MKSLNRKVQKILSFISGLSLIFNSFAVLSPVYAQTVTPTDTTTPTPTDTIIPTDTTFPTPTDTVTPTDTLTPTPTGQILDGVSTESATPTESLTPTDTATPTPGDTSTPTNTPDQSTPTPAAQSTATPTPTVTPSPTPEVNGHLEAAILKNANALSLDLSSTDINGSAVLTTNKPDYAPTDTVVISGTGFVPEHPYKLFISSTDPPAVNFETEIKTDATGTFIYSYQLDGNYRPNYSVTVKEGDTIVATTTFTDSVASITLNPTSGPSGTSVGVSGSHFNKGDSISITFNIVTQSTSGSCTVANSGGFGPCNFTVPSVADGPYTVTANDTSNNSASATFTVGTVTPSGGNPAANLEQCHNGSGGSFVDCVDPSSPGNTWGSGNAGQNNALLYEGNSQNYRLILTNVATGSAITVNISQQYTKGGKMAYDYPTGPGNLGTSTTPIGLAGIFPCDDNNGGLLVSPCPHNVPSAMTAGYKLLISNIPAGTIPDSTVDGETRTSQTTYYATPESTLPTRSPQYMYVYGANSGSFGGYSFTGTSSDVAGGDTDLNWNFTITPTTNTVVIAWGAHISRSGDYGTKGTAVSISGSPYHTVFDSATGVNSGSQDMQMAANAVIPLSSITIHKVTSPAGGKGFGFTTTGGLSPATFNLDDGGISTYSSVIPGTYTVVENDPTSNSYSLTGLTCGTASGTGTSAQTNLGTRTVSITIGSSGGGIVDCTYTNTLTVVTPSINTTPSPTSGTIGTNLNDSATLSGGNSPTGSITFKLYSPTDLDCITPVYTSAVTVSGNNSYSSSTGTTTGSNTANSAGTWHWSALYSGDSLNNPASSLCNEAVTIRQNSPTIATSLSSDSVGLGINVHDSATLTGATSDAGGTVTYHAYAGANTCSGTDLLNSVKTVTAGTVPDSDTISFTSAGTYSFQAVYSGDGNNAGATSVCSTEQLVVNKNSPTIATTLANETITVGGSTNDTATLSNATSNAGGTVTYSVYTDSSCKNLYTNQPSGTANVTNGTVDNSSSETFSDAGDYYWQAVYSGDGNNNGATSTCTSEHLVVGKAQPSIVTNASASVTVGQDIKDTATISDLVNPDGTAKIGFTLYSDSSCKNQVTTSQSGFVTSNGNYDSSNYTTTNAGTYYWIANFPGDANNQSATTSCGDANESSVTQKATPTLTTTASGPVTVGQDVHDVAHLSGGYGTLGGSVTFDVFAPGDTTCQTPIAVNPSQTVSGANDYTSGDYTTSAVGDYRWIAHYSGDSNNKAVDTACNDANESSATNKATPEITTQLYNSDNSTLANNGDANSNSVFDSATVTGGYNPAGNVTFRFYNSVAACTRDSDFKNGTTKGTKDLVNGTASPSDSADNLIAGNYAFKAQYNGDDNNNPATSDCEPFYVTTLKVDKTLIPSGDPGRFDLRIDGDTKASDVGDGGTTDPVIVASGSHTVSEIAGDENTDLKNYTSSIDCTNDDSGPGNSLDTSITAGEAVTCTITNTRQTGTLIVHKIQDTNGDGTYDTLDSKDFTWGTDGSTYPYAMGGTGQTLNTGPYSVTESSVTGYQLTGWYTGKPQGGEGRYSCDTENTSLPANVTVANSEIPTEITICNKIQNPILTITKENNTGGGNRSPGDNVLFTITVTATQSAAFNVHVTDLPAGGFTYRPGSWTANTTDTSRGVNGDLKAGGITTEPTYHSPGVWNLGNMKVGETVTLTYLADISGSQQPGTYYDLAWASGCKTDTGCSDVLANAVTPGFVADNYVGTQVPIVNDQHAGANVNVVGQVLGASTELPATGADAFWLYVALGLITGGVGFGAVGWYIRRKYAK